LRNDDTYTWTMLLADSGGASPHRPSMISSTPTGEPGRSASRPSTARGSGGGTGSSLSLSRSSIGPSTPIRSNCTPTHLQSVTHKPTQPYPIAGQTLRFLNLAATLPSRAGASATIENPVHGCAAENLLCLLKRPFSDPEAPGRSLYISPTG
jgi:hypothetical protein